MRLLSDIRFGTERYPEKVARRLRTVNFGTRIAAAGSALFFALSLAYFVRFWWLALTHLVMMALFASIPLLHRFGSQAGGVTTLVVFCSELLIFIYLIGTDAGIQFHFLLVVALTVLYLGAEHIAVTAASAVLSAALIVVVQLTVPDDTGLLPRSLVVSALVSNSVLVCGSLLLLATYALGEIARAEIVAEREYERSERLLANILPAPIAARLKDENNLVIADRHDEASILFADMEGFTSQASDTTPEDLVNFLNRVFSDFDRLVDRHGLEKIKTTGDAYMVVSGVPITRSDHAQALAVLALDPPLTSRYWVRPIPQQLRSEPGSIPIGAIVETRTAWAVPAAEELACLFLRANTERHLVGISVGIGNNR